MSKFFTKYTSGEVMNSSLRILYFKEFMSFSFFLLSAVRYTPIHHEQCIFIIWKGKKQISTTIPLDTGRKLDVHETFRRCPGCLWTYHVRSIYVLCPGGSKLIEVMFISTTWLTLTSKVNHHKKVHAQSHFW